MDQQVGSEALIPNPRIAAFEPLIGVWATVGRHAMMPGVTLDGRASFEWHQGGAFVLMRTAIEEPGIPSAVAVIGSDDVADTFTMLYFDECTVTRREVSTSAFKTIHMQ